MRTTEIIEGLTILEKYYDKPNPGFNTGIVRDETSLKEDVMCARPTDREIDSNDLNRLIELNWYQVDELWDNGNDKEFFAAKHYKPEECWLGFPIM